VSRCLHRLEVLDVLATRSAQARSDAEAAAALVAALQESQDEVPFALLYLAEGGGASVRLAAAVGIETSHPAAVAVIELSDASCVWPLRQAVNTPLETPLPTGPWPDRAHAALVIPLRSGDSEGARCFGFLVAGEGPGAPPDAGYRTFLRLACTQFTTAVARAEVRTKLERTAEAAETALRAKDDFVAMLGHELRNPLSPILTALQLIRMRGSESRELVVIERQVGHLVRLVDDLLDVSRITGGKITLRKQRLELAVIVARGLEMVSPLLDQKKHHLELEVMFEGLVVDADADRLAQVISNLLTNAAKYSDAGTTIRVTTSRNGNRAKVSVRDEGVGIPAHMLDAIFDRFVQQPQPLDRSKGGLGLGLTIVRSLLELHGGTIAVQSDGPGMGSEFSVELPLAQLDEQLDVDSTPGWSAKHGSKADPARNRVLVVDDNCDAADSIAELLTEFGYEVAVAYDGPTALTVADTFKPHTCVLDIGLPVMDGYELARLLRQSDERLPGLRLIAITGYGQDTDRHRSTEAGFDAHLVKPVQIDELAKIVMN
jgi:signal transduction histidine kinase/CheY-like chemotaxis protein